MPEETKRLAGKVAVITGGASGIGAAAVRKFHAEGAHIVMADLRKPDAAQFEDISDEDLRFVQADVTKAEDIRGLLAAAQETFGGIDILLANAGIQGPLVHSTDFADDDWEKVLNIDLNGAVLLCKYGIPALQKRGGGAVVITASLSAFDAATMTPPYAAAKAALTGLTESLAYDYGPDRIRVNSVCPAAVRTPLFENGLTEFMTEEEIGVYLQTADSYPLGRRGDPEDIAALMCFLASEEASFVTGRNIIIDGGFWAGYPWKPGKEETV